MSEPSEQNITTKQAEIILQFLQRAQMQGAEMPAYVDVFNRLSGIVADAKTQDTVVDGGAQ